MFCPKCNSEYREGISVCPTCNIDLVNVLPDSSEPASGRLTTVYKTGNPAIIAFIKSAFEADGIKFFAKGENLQDLFAAGRFGTGFNPVVGPVEFQVEEKDSKRATEILDLIEEDKLEEEKENIETEYDRERKGKQSDRDSRAWVKSFVIGLTIGAVTVWGIVAYYYKDDLGRAHYTGVITSLVKKDSKPLDFYTYENGIIKQLEMDRNFDGQKDALFFYKKGILDRGYSDDFFDGKMGTSYFYDQYGRLVRIEIDTNHDNKPEIIESYTDGVISRKRWYHESSRVMWKEAFFSGGVMTAEYIDSDYDGTFDVKIIYNSSERPVSSAPVR